MDPVDDVPEGGGFLYEDMVAFLIAGENPAINPQLSIDNFTSMAVVVNC